MQTEPADEQELDIQEHSQVNRVVRWASLLGAMMISASFGTSAIGTLTTSRKYVQLCPDIDAHNLSDTWCGGWFDLCDKLRRSSRAS